MSTKKLDLTGHVFGKLTAICQAPYRTGNPRIFWKCLCQCGQYSDVLAGHLRSGNTKSCGCMKYPPIQHGHSRKGQRTKEYNIWISMKQRCYNENEPAYQWYGARGITVCARWLDSYANFIDDMGGRPVGMQSLDRIDNDGPYSKDNCRWATRSQQARNMSNTRLNDEAVKVIRHLAGKRPGINALLARLYGTDSGTVSHIINREIWK